MSRTPKNNDDINDADIAALFAATDRSAQFSSPPPELDALVLGNARSSHQQGHETPAPVR